MKEFMLTVLNMSISGAIVVLAILLARLILKKAPKKCSYLLWGAAAFRLCCPVSIKSAISLFNFVPKAANTAENAVSAAGRLEYIQSIVRSTQAPISVNTPLPNTTLMPQITPHAIQTSVPAAVHEATSAPAATQGIIAGLTENIGGSGGAGSAAQAASSVGLVEVLMTAAVVLWIVGMIALIAYSVIGYIKMYRKMSTAVLLEGNIYQSELVRSPFILGFLRPKIYIPYGLSEEARRYVLAHERYHIKRGDHIIKVFSFLLLALHWFNPLCWLAFFLSNKDMEMSCDEKVLGEKLDIRSEYSSTLLSFAVSKQFPSPSPLAFGESGVRSRIKNAMNYKKPKFIVTIIALVLSLAVLAACVANPANAPKTDPKQSGAPIAPTTAPTAEPTAAPNAEEPVGVVFADPVFEAEYRKTRSDDAGNIITDEELLGVTSLSFGFSTNSSFSEISDISDVAKFKNLETFKLNKRFGSQAIDIEPLSELTSIHSLWLYNCGVSDLAPLGGLTGLHQLILGGNGVSLEGLDTLGSFTELRYLMLENCGIGDISFIEPLTKLEDLDLSGNSISNLKPLPRLAELETLILDNNEINGIESLCKEGLLPKLRVLSLNNNRISNVYSLSTLNTLEQLMLSDNWLDEDHVLALSQMMPNCEIVYERAEDSVDYWAVDLDGDGAEERFCLSLALLKNESYTIPYLIGENGENLGGLDMIGYSRVWNRSYILTEKEGIGRCIMVYKPGYASGGECEYSYKLYTVKNDALICAEERSINFMVHGSVPAQPNDIDKVLEFAGEVNALLERGTLLISADAYCGLTKFGLFDRESGENIDTTSCECVINSNGLTITSNLPAAPTSDGGSHAVSVPFCMFTQRELLCRESLSILDFVLGERDDFPSEGSLREKLEYANYVLESNRAIAKAGEYVGIGNYTGVHIIKESIASNGSRSYLVYIPEELLLYNTDRNYVLVSGDSVIGIFSDPSAFMDETAVNGAIEAAREYLLAVGYSEAASASSLRLAKVIENENGTIRYFVSFNRPAMFVAVENGAVIYTSPDLGTVEAQLRLSYPQYFGLHADYLDVYITKRHDHDEYCCILTEVTNSILNDFSGLPRISLEEMNIILSTYNADRESVNVYLPYAWEEMRPYFMSKLFD